MIPSLITVEKEPLISVIVPSYNHSSFLSARLNSIANQTYSNIEIILLDDASTDGSREILENFYEMEKRVSYVEINQQNSGSVNEQWLKGLKHTRGEYIWIAESDDLAESSFLMRLHEQFQIEPEIGLVYCDSIIIDENGNKIESYNYRFKHFSSIWDKSFIIDGKIFMREYLIFNNVIPNVSAVLFKKSHLEKSLKRNDFVYLGDWVCYIKIAANSKIAFVKEKLNFFRKHMNTTRWHNKISYKREMKEKIALLRIIKNEVTIDSDYNISLSLSRLFLFRHKHKKINSLVNTLSKIESRDKKVSFYGLNDICDILVNELARKLTISSIFDEKKSGYICKVIPVLKLTQENLHGIDIIVICSLEHSQNMKTELTTLSYRGLIFAI